MTSPDTNVLVRILTKVDPEQARRASERLDSEPFWIAKTVLMETEWVLRRAYQLEAEQINQAFRRLLGLPGANVEDQVAVHQALEWQLEGMDFADALHLASSHAADTFLSFDRALVRIAAAVHAHTRVQEP